MAQMAQTYPGGGKSKTLSPFDILSFWNHVTLIHSLPLNYL